MRWIDVGMFFLTIAIIWAAGGWRAHRGHRSRGGWRSAFHPLGFVIGNDNRLSLSRLQAFLWTMVIFGSYAAAWKAHKAVQPATPEAIQKIEALATHARERAIESHAAATQSAVNAQLLGEIQTSAVLDSVLKFPAPIDSAKNASALDSVRKNLSVQRKDSADARTSSIAADRLAAIDARRATALEADAARYKWILIPAGLLALAGISIGSGVFSSLISAVNSKGIHPCVTSIRAANYQDLSSLKVSLGTPRSIDVPCVVIEGASLGHDGRVRFDGDYADILYWGDAGNIAVVVPPVAAIRDRTQAWSGTLILDTSNGKIAYGTTKGVETKFNPSGMLLTLGSPTDALEWSDLFRDDSNPSNLDLMKFQMFGWTIISVGLYLWNFFVALAAQRVLAALPSIDDSLVILMGVSQAAYLTNKGVQNVPPTQRDTAPAPAPAQASSTVGGLIPPDLPPTAPSGTRTTP